MKWFILSILYLLTISLLISLLNVLMKQKTFLNTLLICYTGQKFTMNNCVLKLIVLIENILNIYRNYESFSITKKIIVSLRMALEIVFAFTVIAINVPRINSDNYIDKYRFVYFSLNAVFSIFVIYFAAYKSTKFNNLVSYLEKMHKYFISDEIYVRNLQRKNKIIKIITIVFGLTSCSIWLYVVNNVIIPNDTFVVLVLIAYFICEIRYFVEYVVLYGILVVLSEQVKSITRSITKDTRTVVHRQNEEIHVEETQDIYLKWTPIYATLKNCSNLINNVFGVQISVLLIIATIYNITLCYNSIANYIHLTQEDVISVTYRETLFIMALFILSRGAHTTQQSVEELRRSLAGLLIRSTADEKVYKVIRDFLRLITCKPLNTQAFGSVIIDMSLLPKFIMFFTSYTVIALQFNNVM